jgi:23S rRNA pseudouridine2605 synthase
MAVDSTGKVRLQRYLADAGVASRRHAEELILEGGVMVNNAVVDTLPAFVDPEKDVVFARGVRVRPQRPEYFLVHKPRGVVCTDRDPEGRTRAIDLLPPTKGKLFVVGRLDAECEGLLLLTNDGELATRITHPSYGVPKTYRVEVRGLAEADLPARLRKGVWLAEGKARATDVKIIHADRQHSMLEVIVTEGRNREIRRMLARLGHPVRRLKRIEIGPLSLSGLPRGAARRLTDAELNRLREALANPQSMLQRRGKRLRGGTGRSAVSGTRPPRGRGAAPRNGGRRDAPTRQSAQRSGARTPERPKRRVIG